MGAAALAALTACGDGPATVAGTWRSPAAWSTLVYATAEGPLLLEVHGDPFGIEPPAFRRQVAAAMADAVPGRPFGFTLAAEQAPQPGIRVVMAFQPAPTLTAKQLCAGKVVVASGPPGAPGVVNDARLTLLAAFCQGEDLLASVSGWVAKLDGPDDRRFALWLRQALRDMIGEAR